MPTSANSRRARRAVRHPRVQELFKAWPEIARRIHAAKRILIFLDFDGTLVGYCPAPDQVRLSGSARRILRKLARHRSVRTAIVSGRRRGGLMRFIKIPGVELMGLYGWEHAKNGVHLPARTIAKLQRAREMLAVLGRELPDVLVEDKGISLALHFRGASRLSRRIAHRRLQGMMRELRPELHLIHGQHSVELAPREVRGKGTALRATLANVQKPFLPIYVGDDWTDEPAFASLRAGITVYVGRHRPTKARYRLAHAKDVCEFLERLEAELPRRLRAASR